MKAKFLGFSSILVSGTVLMLGTAAQAQVLANYVCDDDRVFDVTYDQDDREAELVMEGETLLLPSIVVGSGAAYSDGVTTLYTQGQEAFVEVDGDRVYSNCLTDTEFMSDSIDVTPDDEPMDLDMETDESMDMETDVEMEGSMDVDTEPSPDMETDVDMEDESMDMESSVENSTTVVETTETTTTVETVEAEPVNQPAPATTTPAPAPAPVRGLW